MLTEVRGITDGSIDYTLRWAPSHKCVVEQIEALNESNSAYVTLCTGVRGANTNNLVALKQGSTLAGGYGIQWTGELHVDSGEVVAAIFVQAATSEVVSLSLKVRDV